MAFKKYVGDGNPQKSNLRILFSGPMGTRKTASALSFGDTATETRAGRPLLISLDGVGQKYMGVKGIPVHDVWSIETPSEMNEALAESPTALRRNQLVIVDGMAVLYDKVYTKCEEDMKAGVLKGQLSAWIPANKFMADVMHRLDTVTRNKATLICITWNTDRYTTDSRGGLVRIGDKADLAKGTDGLFDYWVVTGFDPVISGGSTVDRTIYGTLFKQGGFQLRDSQNIKVNEWGWKLFKPAMEFYGGKADLDAVDMQPLDETALTALFGEAMTLKGGDQEQAIALLKLAFAVEHPRNIVAESLAAAISKLKSFGKENA